MYHPTSVNLKLDILEKDPIPPHIGLGPVYATFLPYIRLSFPTSKVFNTTNWEWNILPSRFRGIQYITYTMEQSKVYNGYLTPNPQHLLRLPHPHHLSPYDVSPYSISWIPQNDSSYPCVAYTAVYRYMFLIVRVLCG